MKTTIAAGPASPRSVADIVYEVNLVSDHIGLTLRNEELFDWPQGWIKAPGRTPDEGCRSRCKFAREDS